MACSNPDRPRRILQLYAEGIGRAEIAEQLGCSRSNVDGTIWRAQRRVIRTSGGQRQCEYLGCPDLTRAKSGYCMAHRSSTVFTKRRWSCRVCQIVVVTRRDAPVCTCGLAMTPGGARTLPVLPARRKSEDPEPQVPAPKQSVARGYTCPADCHCLLCQLSEPTGDRRTMGAFSPRPELG